MSDGLGGAPRRLGTDRVLLVALLVSDAVLDHEVLGGDSHGDAEVGVGAAGTEWGLLS